MRQHLASPKTRGYKKIELLKVVDIIIVTNCIFYQKYYLIFTKMGILKNNIGMKFKKVYSLFLIWMVPSEVSNSHTIVSPFSIPNTSRMVFGIEINLLPPCCCTFDSKFTFITSFIMLFLFILLYWGKLIFIC